MRAAGVQPHDCAVRQGRAPLGAGVGSPTVLGNEFSGVVDETGPDATGFPVGTEVVGFAVLASCAEFVVGPTDRVVGKPDTMTFEEGGGLSGCGQTAHTALEVLGVREGETLLVHAAAGGVGTVAVQLAVARGATVTGTASEGNHDSLRSSGAIPVTYGDGLVERVRALAPRGVDAALHGAGEQAPLVLRGPLTLGRGRDVSSPWWCAAPRRTSRTRSAVVVAGGPVLPCRFLGRHPGEGVESRPRQVRTGDAGRVQRKKIFCLPPLLTEVCCREGAVDAILLVKMV